MAIAKSLARHIAAGVIVGVGSAGTAAADSSSPLLAAYYDRQMAIVDGAVYAWKGSGAPKRLPAKAIQVGVGRDAYYALTGTGELLAFRDHSGGSRVLMTGVARFAAGQTGILAITPDNTLWWRDGDNGQKRMIAKNIAAAAVGDGANYFIDNDGALFVRGAAHRGQYGDGRLKSTDSFVVTASKVARITAHTGHAILLKTNGDVMGTGGNIFGPVGRHGLGDKAVRWSLILKGARAIATGSSHTLAIREDATLMAWGREYGPEPVPVMAGVTAAAAGTSATLALKRDGSLWRWDRGGKPRRVLLNPK